MYALVKVSTILISENLLSFWKTIVSSEQTIEFYSPYVEINTNKYYIPAFSQSIQELTDS